MFKSWFVNFDPVKAKVDGHGQRLLKGLIKQFPAGFENSEFGETPKSWKVGKLENVVTVVRDQLTPSDWPTEVFSHYSIPAFDESRLPRSEKGADIKSSKFKVPSGAVLLSKLNPETARVWMVDVEPDRRSICSTEFLVLQPMPPFSRVFIYCLLKSCALRRSIVSLVTGTSNSHQRAQPSAILNLPILVPAVDFVTAFDKFAAPLLDRVLAGIRESQTLVVLRDTLLPKLISGELRVKAAEKIVEAVA